MKCCEHRPTGPSHADEEPPIARLSAHLLSLLRFLAAGLPGFAIAVTLNYLFVAQLELIKALSYAVVLLVQVTVNFFTIIVFVFHRDTSKSMIVQYLTFLSGVLAFRAADWGFYLLLTEAFGVYFLLAQGINVIVFSVAKYSFARFSIEGRAGASRAR